MVPPTRLLTYPGYGDHDYADDEFDTYGYCQCEEPDLSEDETVVLIPDDPAEERLRSRCWRQLHLELQYLPFHLFQWHPSLLVTSQTMLRYAYNFLHRSRVICICFSVVCCPTI